MRKVRHFYQQPAHRQFAVPRTTLSLGASGLVWPEDFFFFKTKERKINVLFFTQWSFLAPQPPLVLSPFFFEVTETKKVTDVLLSCSNQGMSRLGPQPHTQRQPRACWQRRWTHKF